MSKASSELAKSLTTVLADTYVLYFKTHSFHWNVEGPQFKQLHDLFEEQYNELWQATDEIAERMRAIGSYAPNSFKEMLGKTGLQETGQTPDAAGMTGMLANDNEKIAVTIKKVIAEAQEHGDEATADLMIRRTLAHEKAAWMLRSLGR
jgi:starvation-inducible DNA-binding protein